MIKVTDKFIKMAQDTEKMEKRGRCNYNFHKDYSEKVQRFLNIAGPETYVRPHKHDNPEKIEAFIILKGRILMVEYDDKGNIRDYFVLDSKKGNFAAEVPPNTWHSFISLKKNSAIYELKEGPFDPDGDKSFAPWAPEEGTEEAQKFIEKVLKNVKL